MLQFKKDGTINVKLIDFGYTSKYLDENGEHLEHQKVGTFTGNLLFASVNTLDYNNSSRKDDFISLSYLMIYLLNRGIMPLITLTAVDQNYE